MLKHPEFRKSYPDFPLLSVDDLEMIRRLFEELEWLQEGESILSTEKAGEGNMNLSLKITTSQREVVLKQARPWVEKYDHIPAPWDRVLYEQGFYERVRAIPEVAERMPKILAADAHSKTLLLEYLPDAQDYSDLYQHGVAIELDEVAALGRYAHALHENTRGQPDSEFENREMRRLNHTHIFDLPLDPDNGLDLEPHEVGLNECARELKKDSLLRESVRTLGDRYLSDGTCLLHGDFFPGSWLRSSRGLYVIDPEFCYFGDVEFDIGVAVAHWVITQQSTEVIKTFLTSYGSGHYSNLVAGYAGVEIIRRTIGVAQLPIPRSENVRNHWLARAREAILGGKAEVLWH